MAMTPVPGHELPLPMAAETLAPELSFPAAQVTMQGFLSPAAIPGTAWGGTAAGIAEQLAARLSEAPAPPGSTVPATTPGTLLLAPPELGRLQIRFDADPAGGLLVIQVERPETLELMRRHLDLLQTTLQAAGQGGCNLRLEAQLRDGQARDSGRSAEAASVEGDQKPQMPGAGASAEAVARHLGEGRLDLRL